MSLLKMLGFEHLPKGAYKNEPFNGLAMADLAPFQPMGYSSGGSTIYMQPGITENGSLGTILREGSSNNTYGSGLAIRNSDLPANTGKYRIGFRIRVNKLTATQTSDRVVVGVDYTVSDFSTTVNTLASAMSGSNTNSRILTISDCFPQGLANLKVGDEAYIEFEVALYAQLPSLNWSVPWWRDGVAQTPKSGNGAAVATAIHDAQRGWVGITAYTNPSNNSFGFEIRDIVLTNDLDTGDGVTDRIGPVRIRPLHAEDVIAPDWTPTSGTPEEVLNAVIGDDPMVPSLVGPLHNSDVVVKFAPVDLAPNEVVRGVSLSTTFLKQAGGSASTVKATLKQGETIVIDNVDQGGTIGVPVLSKPLILATHDAHNENWNETSIRDLELTLSAIVEG